MPFEGWSRQEILQLIGIITAAIASALATAAAFIGRMLMAKVHEVHVLINSGLAQMLAGARAQGRVEERSEADAREDAKRDVK